MLSSIHVRLASKFEIQVDLIWIGEQKFPVEIPREIPGRVP